MLNNIIVSSVTKKTKEKWKKKQVLIGKGEYQMK